MIKVEINKKAKCDLSDSIFRDIIKATLKKLNILDARISLAIVGDKEMQNLNLKYRKIDEPTDVLSFCNAEIVDGQELEKNYLGEIIIDFNYIIKQAKEMKHDIKKETKIIVNHGLMHLLGYTHEQMRELNIEAI